MGKACRYNPTICLHSYDDIKSVDNRMNATTSERGPMNDKRTGSNSRPFNTPSETSNNRITKKYLHSIMTELQL